MKLHGQGGNGECITVTGKTCDCPDRERGLVCPLNGGLATLERRASKPWMSV